jgi:hypothetical protein
MSIDASRHDEIYHTKWVPMEESIGRGNMEDFSGRHAIARVSITRRLVAFVMVDVFAPTRAVPEEVRPRVEKRMSRVGR